MTAVASQDGGQHRRLIRRCDVLGSVAGQLAAAAQAMQAHGPAVIEGGIVRPLCRPALADEAASIAAGWTTRAVIHAAHVAAVRGDWPLASAYRDLAFSRFHRRTEGRAAA